MSQHVRVERVSDVLQQRAPLLATAMNTYKCRVLGSSRESGRASITRSDKARMLALSAAQQHTISLLGMPSVLQDASSAF